MVQEEVGLEVQADLAGRVVPAAAPEAVRVEAVDLEAQAGLADQAGRVVQGGAQVQAEELEQAEAELAQAEGLARGVDRGRDLVVVAEQAEQAGLSKRLANG